MRQAHRGGGREPRDGRGRRGWRRSIQGIVAVLAFLTLTWTGFRALAFALAPRLGLVASGWGGGFFAFASTLAAFALAVNIVSIHVRRQYPDAFVSMREAMRRIAAGDFDVKLSLAGEKRDHPFSGFAGEINLLAESLKRMEDMRQEFISTVSHEIQSPLTSIGGFAKALREEGLAEEKRLRYLAIIEDESDRLSLLSEALLRLTALESRGLEPRGPGPGARPIALDEQIRSAVIAAEPQWAAKSLALELDLARVAAWGDEGALSQVWTNLIHNAVKFSSPEGRLSISLRREGDRVLALFADEGLGIAAEDLPRVFDRFFKADRSRTRSDPASGSGLGLAIAKKIVELHGGAIRAESPGLGKGSAFTVELPIAAAEQAPT
jgi:two-component system, OmpR family, phosphate regulon sensor histidine kinase PhoR